jgi:dienelactone hydrolase
VRELVLTALAVGLLFAGGRTLAQAPATSPPPAAAAITRFAAEPYMRVTNNATGAVELQVAARKLVPANGKGPVIWLTGVSHIGETNYYAQLQKHLEAQALVLFEGVNAGRKPAATTNPPAPPPAAAPAPAPAAKAPERTSLQKDLAESLGLVFQLEAINYARPHFRNSDLSVAQLQELMEQGDSPDPAAPESAKEKRKNEAFDTLLKAMEGDSLFGSLLKAGFKLVGGNPRFQAMTKLALIEALGSLRGDLSRMKSLPEDVQRLMEVLIQSRNDAVLRDLRAELKRAQPPASISVFYGAGHMDDLERRLRREFGYRPDGDLWLPAFSVDYSKAGLNVIEATFIRAMIQRQIQELLPAEKPDGEK